jgi:hypothetical protein
MKKRGGTLQADPVTGDNATERRRQTFGAHFEPDRAAENPHRHLRLEL